MALYNITDPLARARELIATGNEHSLLYAALELRFCFESVAYQNLAAYGEEVSAELTREWRPDQIIRMLAQFDPHSDQTASFSISVSPLPDDLNFETSDLKKLFGDQEFLPIGEAKRIPWSKFRTYYNTLGSYLHLQKDRRTKPPRVEKLQLWISELEDVANSTLIAAAKDIATSKCSCGQVLILGPAEQAGDKAIFCPSTKCNASYIAIKNDPEHRIEKILAVGLLCKCTAMVPFAPDKLLKPTVCPNCKAYVRAHIGADVMMLSDPPMREDESGS
ncbi:hypothetical protein [Xanthomonas cannabis]|uniref:hypothetical protein n=1 Tax=Xanthomonas cannabis TaxID=1885674 RepID=UPI000574F20E|nr:hypothetical protein [Xanthomonas cannabis]KHL54561.1 hypothetical protein OZ10_12830 [Xanthomonas cannabis pv. cannabis]